MPEYRSTYLTPQEEEQVYNWLTENDCDLSRGDIVLSYVFWIFGPNVTLEYISPTKKMTIEIREDELDSPPEIGLAEKTVNTLSIGALSIPLTLSPTAFNAFISRVHQSMAGHFAEDCEFPGIRLSFHINQTGYRIYADSHEIETISFN